MKKIRVIVLFAVALGQVMLACAEFRVGIAVKVVTPDPLLPVSGGTAYTFVPAAILPVRAPPEPAASVARHVS